MKKETRSGWWWVPSLYYVEGIPYNIAMVVSVVMYKTMGISNSKIALWTSLLYLPWTIKPLWSPFVDTISTKRVWIFWMQLFLGFAFLAVAFGIGLPLFFPVTIGLFWVIALASATHDIAADGFYLLGLDENRQAFFVGIRSTFYRIATITAVGLIVMFAGYVESNTGLEPVTVAVEALPQNQLAAAFNPDSIRITEQSGEPEILIFPKVVRLPLYNANISGRDSTNIYIALSAPPDENQSISLIFGRKSGSKDISLSSNGRFEFTRENWNKPFPATIKVDHRLKSSASAIFKASAGNTAFSWSASFVLLGVMLLFFAVYHKIKLPHPPDVTAKGVQNVFSSYITVFATFFKKEGIVAGILFLLLYRLGESQLVKLASPFLLDAQEAGGLGLTTSQVGFVYGTVGVIALLIGGLLGGFLTAKYGLKKWIWWMAAAINLPNAVYIFLSYALPEKLGSVLVCVAFEQFGYGFGFAGYMLYMIYLSEGEYKTSHFALTTAFMALGMMIPGMVSGWIQELVGYQHFFIWVLLSTIPGFIVIKFLKLEPAFGKKKA